MVFLEDKLIKKINSRDEKKALEIYDAIIGNLINVKSNSKSTLRHIKNYLISLNTIIYINYCNYPICKKNLFKLRSNFTKKIESYDSTKDLILLGREMISFYIHNIDKNEFITKNPIINDALNYINNNLHENLNLEKVSKSIHVSRNYLSYLFSKFTGHSFSYYINRAKIEKSKELLINTNLSLIDIALECGFNSQSYFCSVFKKFEGMTPKQYRNKIYNKPS